MEPGEGQEDLWGTRASDWAAHQEVQFVTLYHEAFQAAGLGRCLRHLDAGCGAGLAVALSLDRGAVVAGFDPSPALLAIARRRAPAADLRWGTIEDPPHPPGIFDVITVFNVAHDVNDQGTFAPLRRQGRDGARLVATSWGDAEHCDMAEAFAAVGAWSPTRPFEGPFGLSAPGRFEGLLEADGFSDVGSDEVACPFRYRDLDQALLGLLSAGPFVAAANQAGEEHVREALTEILLRHRRPDGSIHLDNVFRLVVAKI